MRPLETSRRRKRPPVRSISVSSHTSKIIAADFGRDTDIYIYTDDDLKLIETLEGFFLQQERFFLQLWMYC